MLAVFGGILVLGLFVLELSWIFIRLAIALGILAILGLCYGASKLIAVIISF
nr:hypothetical protein [uncultured Campylobacter sp.]